MASAPSPTPPSAHRQRFARRLLLVQYNARLPPRSTRFRWPDARTLLAIQPHLYSDLLDPASSSSPPVPSPQQPPSASSSLLVHPKTKTYRATQKYEKTFLRELTSRLQDAVDQESARLKAAGGVDETEYPEVDAALLERYAELMACGSIAGTQPATRDGASSMLPPECEHVTYLWQTPSRSLPFGDHDICQGEDRSALLRGFAAVTVREEGSAISKGTTGLKTWEACLRLANYLLVHPELIAGPDRRVLELGSGAGLLGTVCAIEQKLKSRPDDSPSSCRPTGQTWLTDVPGQVLDRLTETMEMNGLSRHGPYQAYPLDWVKLRDQVQAREAALAPADDDGDDILDFLARIKPKLVLAADVVYDPDLTGPLAKTIRVALESALDGSDAKALVASTIRNPATYQTFLDALVHENLMFSAIPIEQKYMDPPLDDAEGMEPVPFFPSVHDPACDGTVELLEIRLQR
ncbi:uncharacterized protein PFL1_01929 [Pseudozyma flocculosa PF-1]|uniref:Uncharacterized protein n=1 Tax=Pseudozyma flocculosa TaxID=84751 RepID=A0A5C3EZ36_9BASI|nr:uncharacterized protein PFL1_01929 [Pseudozyma flocculosa PF-1]EPQ30403.1 hypothetical protein PFL1_01929 [Pseudozyma flocculosa PF-1]SPO37478.1 uncharacterized protein PSFLO_02953 [Pseudozyma flocculosa]